MKNDSLSARWPNLREHVRAFPHHGSTRRRVAAAFGAAGIVAALACACACGSAGARPNVTASQDEVASEARPPIGVGRAAPPFTGRALDGTPVTIPARRPTVLVFFATWSAPDMQLASRLSDIALTFPDARVIGVNIDDEERGVRPAVTAYGINYPVIWDREHALAERYRPESDPSLYILDAEGTIRFIHAGYRGEEQAGDIERDLATLSPSEPCAAPLRTKNGVACFRQCGRISSACATGKCPPTCTARTCEERCTRENSARNDALASCREPKPKGRAACERSCHEEARSAAIETCAAESAGRADLVAECDAACGVGPCRASCARGK